MKKFFSIDLSISSCCVSYLDEYDHPIVVCDYNGNQKFENIIYFESANSIIVGEDVLSVCDPENICRDALTHLGDNEWSFNAHGVNYTAGDMLSLILKYAYNLFKYMVGDDIYNVVISYPDYFAHSEKEAILMAAQRVNINVIATVTHSLAAVLCYKHIYSNSKKDETLLIYDMGAVCCSISVVKCNSNKINIIAHKNDRIGGKDWTDKIKEYVMCLIIDKYNIPESIYNDFEFSFSLDVKCEIAKRKLSATDPTMVKICYNEIINNIKITNKLLDQISAELLDQTIFMTHDVKNLAINRGCSCIDKIILVGGGVKLQQVRRRLSIEFSNLPIELLDPELAIAKGAAIYGNIVTCNN